eukprot:CAMPEP_0117505714 /NCGR_PEP_ID=MMETSP0784-20121206/25527_1 /TAXON_ID=39447 /ORGANISM="" /LENGTH=166 /DNA_ID=CAMNT_0005301149 /DNA_START=93 /DNA_END=590 /DNA_ORIENTATION=-
MALDQEAGHGTEEIFGQDARSGTDADVRLRVRRPPPRLTAENHIYVSRRQSLAILNKIARKLLDKQGHMEIFVHGMGAMITKAIHLAQDLLLCYGEELSLEPAVGTVDVVDDLLGNSFDQEDTAELRHVSSLTLRLSRCRSSNVAADSHVAGTLGAGSCAGGEATE